MYNEKQDSNEMRLLRELLTVLESLYPVLARESNDIPFQKQNSVSILQKGRG
jgi:hypothetical protein